MINVLVIDDDSELYCLLRDYFTNTEFRLEHAGDAETGLSRILVGPNTWDAVILDIMLPGLNGLEALACLRASPETGDLPILILTARDGEKERVAGLETGADDYLVKPFSLMELAARLRALLRRSRKRDTDRIEQRHTLDNLIVDRTAHTVRIEGNDVQLTPAEMQLLDILLAEPGKTVPREKLYERLFGHVPKNNERGLDMTVSRLRKKLGPRADGGERIQAVWGAGYVFLATGEQS